MKWNKQGVIFTPSEHYDWMMSHAQMPIVDRLSDDVLRIFFGTRNASNLTSTAYIDVEADNPKNVLYVHPKPAVGLGELGCFDDGGALPAWIVNYGGLKYLYYIGWNAGVTVGYRNSIGLAVSDDGGDSFSRMFKGPVVDRTKTEPQFCSSPCVLFEDGLWRMWYLSCVRWEVIDGRSEPIYHIKYAQSPDGIHWDRKGIVCIDLKSREEGGIARPCVVKEEDHYSMWYCYRGIRDYRTNPEHTYRIGYARSDDGIKWTRMDETAGINVAEEGWDSEMIGFPYVYAHKGRHYMIYNGNQFGKTGLGYAVRDD